MLSYETALKLKEVGFPQKTEFELLDSTKPRGYIIYNGDNSVYVPILEELTEACPKTHKIDEWFDGNFILEYSNIGSEQIWYCGYDAGDDWFEGPTGEGSSPIEAVAKLYISLNEKQKTAK